MAVDNCLAGKCCSPGAAAVKIPKIGWLGARTPSAPSGGPGTGAELFRREFSKLGYIEGKNITIEYRYADDQLDRLPAWLRSWSVSKLTCSSLPQRWKPEPPRTLPGRFPSSFLTYLILLHLGG